VKHEEKIGLERLKREEQEKELHTAHPHINERSKAIARSTSVDMWLMKRHQKMKDVEAQVATIAMASCTFSPRLNQQSVRMWDAFERTSEEVQDRILREHKEKAQSFAEKRQRILVEEFGETFSPTITQRAHGIQREGKIWDRLHAQKLGEKSVPETSASPRAGQHSLSTPRKDKRDTTAGWAAVGKSVLDASEDGSEDNMDIQEHDFTQHKDGPEAETGIQPFEETQEEEGEVEREWATRTQNGIVDGVQVQALKYTPDLDSFVSVMELFSMPADIENGTQEEAEPDDGIQTDPEKNLTMMELARQQESQEAEARALKLANKLKRATNKLKLANNWKLTASEAFLDNREDAEEEDEDELGLDEGADHAKVDEGLQDGAEDEDEHIYDEDELGFDETEEKTDVDQGKPTLDLDDDETF